jgi:hypothetical protein
LLTPKRFFPMKVGLAGLAANARGAQSKADIDQERFTVSIVAMGRFPAPQDDMVLLQIESEGIVFSARRDFSDAVARRIYLCVLLAKSLELYDR